MGIQDSAAVGQLDRTYVAYCLATEIIRIKRSAAKARATSSQNYDWARLLAQPLEQLAERLGLKQAVDGLVQDAMRDVDIAAPPLVQASPLPPPPGGTPGAPWHAANDEPAASAWRRIANGANSHH